MTRTPFPRSLLAAVMGVVSLLVCLDAAQAQSHDLAIRDVTIVDVTDGSLHAGQTILISGNRITAVGEVQELEVRQGAEVIDAAGSYVIPGLWDMHTHHSWDSFRLHIANGVTGVRDMGISRLPLTEILALRGKVMEGKIVGPRFAAAGPTVDGRPSPSNDTRVSAMTPEQGRDAVDSLNAAGADFIKVYHLSRDTYFAIADEAAKQQIPIAGHLSPEVTLEEAATAGQRSIEHFMIPRLLASCSSQPELLGRAFRKLYNLDALPRDSVHIAHRRRIMELVVDSYDETRCRMLGRRLAEYDMWHTPTLMMGMNYPRMHDDSILRDPRLKYMSQSRRERFERIRLIYISGFSESEVADFRRTVYRIVANMHRAGVGLLVGTDATGGFPLHGFGVHDELALLVDVGLSPLEALQAATINPARFLGRSDELGTVEPGRLADLVLLDANPIEDISNTQRIHAVVSNGRLYRRADLDRLLAEVKAAQTSP